MHKEGKEIKRALLVGTYTSETPKELTEEYLHELERLCDTFGLEVAGRALCPLRKMDAGTFLGTGKIDELVALSKEQQADIVIFDDEISPQQQRNLEKLFASPVIDRMELIIDVFAQRAQTSEARLQVELAKVKYQIPRLKRLWTHLSRQVGGGGGGGGGGYLKGVGEQQIELDRRQLRKKVDRLEKELEAVAAQRKILRTQRERSGIPTFAIVGYTNAGKSTLLNALTKAGVFAEDKLFATLDPTTRKFLLPNRQEILLIDTVGFIRKIPTTLIAAFKSTLEEAIHTDILLHLLDVSHPMVESQAEETERILQELGASDQPIITVLNKIDACSNPAILQRLRIQYPKTVQISALRGTGFDLLMDSMMQEISRLRKVVKLKIPQSHYALVSTLMREGRVMQLDYEENDVLMQVEIPKSLEPQVKPFLCE